MGFCVYPTETVPQRNSGKFRRHLGLQAWTGLEVSSLTQHQRETQAETPELQMWRERPRIVGGTSKLVAGGA